MFRTRELPWRSTLRGVVVARAPDDVVLLEGLAATCWRLLDDHHSSLELRTILCDEHPTLDGELVDDTLLLMERERLIEP